MGHKFPVLSWREGRGSFRASVLVAPEVVVQGRGSTRREALSMVRDSVYSYLRAAREYGLSTPADGRFTTQTIKA